MRARLARDEIINIQGSFCFCFFFVGGLKSFGLQYFNYVSSRAIMALGFVDPFCPRHL